MNHEEWTGIWPIQSYCFKESWFVWNPVAVYPVLCRGKLSVRLASIASVLGFTLSCLLQYWNSQLTFVANHSLFVVLEIVLKFKLKFINHYLLSSHRGSNYFRRSWVTWFGSIWRQNSALQASIVKCLVTCLFLYFFR
jgi:hypothetical protein